MSLLGPQTISYLSALRANNTRDWFEANRSEYETVLKHPAAAFAAAMAGELERQTGTAHTAKILRIHRDVRFSRDKTPYNSHLRISFTPVVSHPCQPAWMFGLEPGQLTVGVGIFAFPGDLLDAWRARIDSPDSDAFAKTLSALEAKGIRLNTPDLKRVPTPFSADHPRAHLLQRKGLLAWIDIDDISKCYGADAIALCAAEFMRGKQVYDWLLQLGR